MKPKIELIAIDIDGTLADPNHQVSERNKEVIRQAQAQGARIVICTGRALKGAQAFIDALDLDADEEYSITSNGAYTQEVGSGRVMNHFQLTAEDYLWVDQFAREHGAYYLGEEGDAIYTSQRKIGYYVSQESYLTGLQIHYQDLGEITADRRFDKLMIVDDEAVIDRVWAAVPAEIQARYTVLRSETVYLEFMNPQASKGQALKALAAELGIPAENIMALGDNHNDLDMIEFAGIGVAMANAADVLKEAADYITKSNAEDGVAFAIEKFVLN